MERDPSLKKAYIDTMEEYQREGWAEESPAQREEEKVRYLPHHMVVKREKRQNFVSVLTGRQKAFTTNH